MISDESLVSQVYSFGTVLLLLIVIVLPKIMGIMSGNLISLMFAKVYVEMLATLMVIILFLQGFSPWCPGSVWLTWDTGLFLPP